MSEISFEAALEAMAANSKAALTADLDCYVDWCLHGTTQRVVAEAFAKEQKSCNARPSTASTPS